MTRSKRSLSLFLAALVVLTSSVFLFGGKAYADGIETPPSPLRQPELVVQQQNQVVLDKQVALSNVNDQIIELLQKKDDLTQQLANVQKDVDVLQQKIAQKKAEAAAEKARIEALKNLFVHINRYASDSRGNTYTPGNCTWYAKSRRPDIPNSLGNANTWYYRAAAQGWDVGLTPKKGAVATTTAGRLGHVAYVEAVTPDGKWVTISEMNYGGLYHMNTRTVYYTEFKYIYQLN